MRQRLATLTRSRAGPVQNGLRSSVTKPRRRSGGAPQNFRLRSKRNSGAALTAAAGNERRRAHPRDAFDKRDRLPIQRSGIAREQSSDQPPQGNEGRKDKRDDTGEGDGKVKVMHDDQRLLQTAAACKTSPCIVCQSGRTSAPRGPRALQTKLGPISDSLMSSVRSAKCASNECRGNHRNRPEDHARRFRASRRKCEREMLRRRASVFLPGS
jgi:hypothetical protein